MSARKRCNLWSKVYALYSSDKMYEKENREDKKPLKLPYGA